MPSQQVASLWIEDSGTPSCILPLLFLQGIISNTLCYPFCYITTCWYSIDAGIYSMIGRLELMAIHSHMHQQHDNPPHSMQILVVFYFPSPIELFRCAFKLPYLTIFGVALLVSAAKLLQKEDKMKWSEVNKCISFFSSQRRKNCYVCSSQEEVTAVRWHVGATHFQWQWGSLTYSAQRSIVREDGVQIYDSSTRKNLSKTDKDIRGAKDLLLKKSWNEYTARSNLKNDKSCSPYGRSQD